MDCGGVGCGLCIGYSGYEVCVCRVCCEIGGGGRVWVGRKDLGRVFVRGKLGLGGDLAGVWRSFFWVGRGGDIVV